MTKLMEFLDIVAEGEGDEDDDVMELEEIMEKADSDEEFEQQLEAWITNKNSPKAVA